MSVCSLDLPDFSRSRSLPHRWRGFQRDDKRVLEFTGPSAAIKMEREIAVADFVPGPGELPALDQEERLALVVVLDRLLRAANSQRLIPMRSLSA